MDGNGTPDLIVANEAGFAMMLLGNGDGTFQIGASYNSVEIVFGVAAADFNGDGRSDLALAGLDYTMGSPSYLDILIAASGQTTGTAISSSPNPSTFGQNVTVSATVTPATATGTINFADANTFLDAVPVTAGTATYTSDYLSAGSHALTAIYSGDGANASSSSPVATQIVNASPSTTRLSSSLNPSVYGNQVEFTATIAPTEATGTVTFLDGSSLIGSLSFCCGSAIFETSSLAAGSHSITAVSSGPSILTSTSAPVIQVVNQQSTRTSIYATPNPSTLGQAVTVTAEVQPRTAAGVVTFRVGTTILGTATLNKKGEAVLTISTLPEGSHILTAQYPGNMDYKGSISDRLPQTVN